MIKLNLGEWNNELPGCSVNRVGLLGFEDVQDEKEKAWRDFFLYYYCDDNRAGYYQGTKSSQWIVCRPEEYLSKCHLLKTNLSTSLFYLVSLVILLYECYKSLTVNKLLELYTMDNYGLFFLFCVLFITRFATEQFVCFLND